MISLQYLHSFVSKPAVSKCFQPFSLVCSSMNAYLAFKKMKRVVLWMLIKCFSRFILPKFSLLFWQGFELLQSALGDPSERVVSATHQVFLPAYAAWTTELGNLQSHLIPTLLNKIEKLLRVSSSVVDIVYSNLKDLF